MTEALLVSNAVLWLLVVALALVVLALARQIGVLHERIAPVGALAANRGPAVGDPAPRLVVPSLAETAVAVGEPDMLERRTLLFFLSPSCPVCKTLLPTLRRVAREASPPVRLLFASDGDPVEHRAFAREHELPAADYLLSTELGLALAVAKLPYAVLLDAGGVVRAQGIVNTREHVESLFEADRLGTGSIQDYLERESRDFETRAAS